MQGFQSLKIGSLGEGGVGGGNFCLNKASERLDLTN